MLRKERGDVTAFKHSKAEQRAVTHVSTRDSGVAWLASALALQARAKALLKIRSHAAKERNHSCCRRHK